MKFTKNRSDVYVIVEHRSYKRWTSNVQEKLDSLVFDIAENIIDQG